MNSKWGKHTVLWTLSQLALFVCFAPCQRACQHFVNSMTTSFTRLTDWWWNSSRSWWQYLGALKITHCDFKMWTRLVLCLTSAMFYFLCLLFCFVLSFLCYAFLFYGISFDPALVNWNVQEPFILQTCYVRTPNISTMISLIRGFLSYFIIPIIFCDIFFQ